VQVVTMRHGRRASSRLSGGRFSLHQRDLRGRVPDARVLHATRAGCAGKPAGAVVQRLRARSRAPFRTGGSSGSAVGRGTWVTEERCDGTRFVVAAGSLRVRDGRSARVVRLHAGDRYLARRR
jgi:hypothetical protein